MSARAWMLGDPAPTDWPVVVGPDGATYGHDTDAEQSEGIPGLYVRQEIKHWPEGGATFGPVGLGFRDIFAEYEVGETLREATPDEAATWLETWLPARGEVSS